MFRTVSGNIVISQEKDCCDSSKQEFQELHISIEDGGGGPFLRIKTDGFAIEGLATDLNAQFLNDFSELLNKYFKEGYE